MKFAQILDQQIEGKRQINLNLENKRKRQIITMFPPLKGEMFGANCLDSIGVLHFSGYIFPIYKMSDYFLIILRIVYVFVGCLQTNDAQLSTMVAEQVFYFSSVDC